MEIPAAAIRRFPCCYEHSIAFSAFSLGVLSALAISEAWDRMESAWCFLAIAWFPSTCLSFFRKARVERPLWAASMLSALVGYDGLLRLIGQGC